MIELQATNYSDTDDDDEVGECYYCNLTIPSSTPFYILEIDLTLVTEPGMVDVIYEEDIILCCGDIECKLKFVAHLEIIDHKFMNGNKHHRFSDLTLKQSILTGKRLFPKMAYSGIGGELIGTNSYKAPCEPTCTCSIKGYCADHSKYAISIVLFFAIYEANARTIMDASVMEYSCEQHTERLTQYLSKINIIDIQPQLENIQTELKQIRTV